jgi:hypothetical protein
MRGLNGSMEDVRVEVVTTTFVASGRPDGIRDLGRLLENLNNPVVARTLELHDPVVRALYRAATQVALDAPLVVRRDEIIFATFEGPYVERDVVSPPTVDAPALLMAPPFQIAGVVRIPAGADPRVALRSVAQGFFLVREPEVYDAEGAVLGEGEQIIVNAAAVQMMSATRQRIAAAPQQPARAIEEEQAQDAPAERARTVRAA